MAEKKEKINSTTEKKERKNGEAISAKMSEQNHLIMNIWTTYNSCDGMNFDWFIWIWVQSKDYWLTFCDANQKKDISRQSHTHLSSLLTMSFKLNQNSTFISEKC